MRDAGARSQILLTGAAVALVTGIDVAVRTSEWRGSWGETGRAIEGSTVLTYPLTAGIAAWIASAPRRRRFAWLLESSSRSSIEIATRTAARVTFAVAAGCLVVGLAAGVLTGTEATYGGPPVWGLAPVLAGFGAASCLGVLAARWLPSSFAPILAVVAVYAVEVLLDAGNPSLRAFGGLIVADSRERTYRFTETWVLGVRALWLLALAWLLLTLAGRIASRWVVPLGATCLLAVPLLLVGDTGMVEDVAAYRPICRDLRDDGRLCMSAAREHVHGAVADAAAPVLARLGGVEGAGWELVEEPIADDPEPAYAGGRLVLPFGVPHGTSGNAHVVDDKRLQADLVSRLLGRCRSAGAHDDGRAHATPGQVIQRWLSDELDIPVDGSAGFAYPDLSDGLYDYAPVADFDEQWRNLTEPDRRAWLSAHGRALVECTLTPDGLVLP